MKNREWDFELRHFGIKQSNTAMKVGTDALALGAWASRISNELNPKLILDVGTGTGILALMMAQSYSEASIDAIELEQGAYHDACFNVSSSPFHKRISVLHGDAISYSYEKTYDLIISNPPYYTELVHANDANRHISRFDGGEGLGILSLMCLAKQYLHPQRGILCFIAPWSRLEEIRRLSTEQMLVIRRLCCLESYPQEPIRVLLCLSLYNGADYIPTINEQLSIRQSPAGPYTIEYQELLAPFMR